MLNIFCCSALICHAGLKSRSQSPENLSNGFDYAEIKWDIEYDVQELKTVDIVSNKC